MSHQCVRVLYNHMNIIEQIDSDLKNALKEKETEKVATLRLLRNSIKQARIKKGKEKDFSEEEAVETLQKEAKQREEAIEQYEKANRDELAQKEKNELELIIEYLPEPADKQEIEEVVSEAINQVAAQGLKDMGRVMGKAMSQLKGRADGNEVKEVVKEKLS